MKKSLILVLVGILLLSTFSTNITFAKSSISNDDVSGLNDLVEVQISKEDLAKTYVLVEAITELDENLNMQDLSSYTPRDIENLSDEAQQLFHLYTKEYNKLDEPAYVTEEEVLSFMNLASNQIVGSEVDLIKTASLGSYKEYYLSHKQVTSIVKGSAWNGGFWGMMAAIAKIWGKSPTVLTLMIVAIPALGAATINLCNKNNKGVVIRHLRVGASHSFTCFAR